MDTTQTRLAVKYTTPDSRKNILESAIIATLSDMAVLDVLKYVRNNSEVMDISNRDVNDSNQSNKHSED